MKMKVADFLEVFGQIEAVYSPFIDKRDKRWFGNLRITANFVTGNPQVFSSPMIDESEIDDIAEDVRWAYIQKNLADCEGYEGIKKNSYAELSPSKQKDYRDTCLHIKNTFKLFAKEIFKYKDLASLEKGILEEWGEKKLAKKDKTISFNAEDALRFLFPQNIFDKISAEATRIGIDPGALVKIWVVTQVDNLDRIKNKEEMGG